MIKTLNALLILSLTFSLVFAAAPPAGNADNGKKIHAKQCTSCHGDEVYLRSHRNVTTPQALLGQINACNHNLKKNLSQGEIDDLVRYLTDTYYKFN